MNNLFIQFYTKKYRGYILCNGFSDVYDYCKNIGEFVWIDTETMSSYVFPFTKGNVYISVSYHNHFSQAIKWADQYPEINFVVGGPLFYLFSFQNKPNLKIINSSAEKFFGLKDFSLNWNIYLTPFKQIVKENEYILLTYAINSICYWHKCTFCNHCFIPARVRKFINPNITDEIDFDGEKHIRLGCPSFQPKYIKNILPLLKDDKKTAYDIYVRPGKKEYQLFKEILTSSTKLPKLKIEIGVEFPSDRLLKQMKKGITVNDLTNFIDIIQQIPNIELTLLYIIGWPNITKTDLDNLETFLNLTLNKYSFVFVSRLICYSRTAIHNTFLSNRKSFIYENGIYKGYIPYLNKESKKLNQQALNMITNKVQKIGCGRGITDGGILI